MARSVRRIESGVPLRLIPREVVMANRIRKLLSSPLFLVASGALFVWFLSAVLPAQSAMAKAWTPEGANFDLSFFYSPSRALDMAAAYTTEGRLAYIAARWSFDLVWPIVYGLFVLSAWSFSLGRVAPGFCGRDLVAGLTLLGPAFDFVENISATVLLASWPGRPRLAALTASIGTSLKWIFVIIGIGGAFVLLFLAGLDALERKRREGR